MSQVYLLLKTVCNYIKAKIKNYISDTECEYHEDLE